MPFFREKSDLYESSMDSHFSTLPLIRVSQKTITDSAWGHHEELSMSLPPAPLKNSLACSKKKGVKEEEPNKSDCL